MSTMDAKLLSPTLSIVLVKTIKALCEINIKFDSKLEIAGSLHIRSDGQKILTCLLDEEIVKGQYNAGRVADLAARLSVVTGSFPFAHIHASANVDHSQQSSLFSAVEGDAHLLGDQQNVWTEHESASTVCHHNGKIPDSGQVRLTDGGMVVETLQQQEETQQAVSAIQLPEDARVCRLSGDRFIPSNPTDPSRKRHNDSASKAYRTAKSNSRKMSTSRDSDIINSPDIGGLSTQTSSRNRVKLPDIRTLAHSLPKIHGRQTRATAVGGSDIAKGFSSPTANTSGALPSLEPALSVEVAAHQDVGSFSHKKKFQCMICGIFLSTKCYLKNHVNAVHTRACVYPCDLCERYFYSAGALRIHKLRHHWQDAKKHLCTHCGETFLLPIELRKHIVKKHEEEEQECPILICPIEMEPEEAELMMVAQAQPKDVSRSSLSPMSMSLCFQNVGEVDGPLTPNSSHTPPSLEAS